MTCKDCIHFDACENMSVMRMHLPTIAYQIVDNCVAFKDKSKFIELPCKVGDIVYAFEDCFGVVLPFMVEQIIITYGEKEPLVEYCANCHDNERDELLADLDFEPKDIGVTVFLTEEEAEKALKERESNA